MHPHFADEEMEARKGDLKCSGKLQLRICDPEHNSKRKAGVSVGCKFEWHASVGWQPAKSHKQGVFFSPRAIRNLQLSLGTAATLADP